MRRRPLQRSGRRTVVKAADGGGRLYLQMLHKVKRCDLEAARRRLKKISR